MNYMNSRSKIVLTGLTKTNFIFCKPLKFDNITISGTVMSNMRVCQGRNYPQRLTCLQTSHVKSSCIYACVLPRVQVKICDNYNITKQENKYTIYPVNVTIPTFSISSLTSSHVSRTIVLCSHVKSGRLSSVGLMLVLVLKRFQTSIQMSLQRRNVSI